MLDGKAWAPASECCNFDDTRPSTLLSAFSSCFSTFHFSFQTTSTYIGCVAQKGDFRKKPVHGSRRYTWAIYPFNHNKRYNFNPFLSLPLNFHVSDLCSRCVCVRHLPWSMHRCSRDLTSPRVWGCGDLSVEMHNTIQKGVVSMETHDVVVLDQVAGLA